MKSKMHPSIQVWLRNHACNPMLALALPLRNHRLKPTLQTSPLIPPTGSVHFAFLYDSGSGGY